MTDCLKNFAEVICNTEIISNFVLGDYSDNTYKLLIFKNLKQQ